MSAPFERSWPGAVRHDPFANFWRTPTHMLCSIRITCCAASSTRRFSFSSRRGLTGKCYRALCRKLSKGASHGVRRITEAPFCESSGYRVTAVKRVCYRAAMVLSEPFLACKVVGEDAMPGACLALYEANPSRDLWKASMLT